VKANSKTCVQKRIEMLRGWLEDMIIMNIIETTGTSLHTMGPITAIENDKRLLMLHSQVGESLVGLLIESDVRIDMYGRSLDLNRQRSESYSPYEPPNEMEYEPRLAQEVLAPRRQLCKSSSLHQLLCHTN
jgi:hypothetical protein